MSKYLGKLLSHLILIRASSMIFYLGGKIQGHMYGNNRIHFFLQCN